MKKILKICLWIFIGLVIALALLPFVFKGKIQETLKKQINQQVNAVVDFEDVSLSFFTAFPAIALDIEKLSIDGTGIYEGVRLLNVESIHLGTDLKSIINSGEGINISSIVLDKPSINVIVSKTGEANYDIMKSSASSTSESPSLFGNIDKYEISEGQVTYTDKQGSIYLNIPEFNHSGKGSFSDIIFDLDTKTNLSKIDLKSGGVTYLNKAQFEGDVKLAVNLEESSYTFKENLMKLNDLDLSFIGKIKQMGNAIDLDLSVEAPNNKVSSILSLIPKAYTQEYGEIKSEGSSFLKGTIKGIYDSTKEYYPNIDMAAQINDGFVQYADLPLPIKDINLDAALVGENKDWSDISFDIKKFGFLINEDRIAGKLKVNQALSNPAIDGFLDGTVDLINLSKAFPMEGIELNSGKITSTMALNALATDIEAQDFSKINFTGEVVATNVDFKYEQWPIKIKESKTKLNPNKVNTIVNEASIGNSDFSGSIINNEPLTLLTDNNKMTTSVDVESQLLDVDELMALSELTPVAETQDTVLKTEDLNLYNSIVINGHYEAKALKYETYLLDNLSVDGGLSNSDLTIKTGNVQLDKSPISLTGKATNVINYVFKDEKLTGKFFFKGHKINANKYLNESTETESLEEPIIIPKNFDLEIYPELQELVYDTYTFTNLDGKIEVKDGQAFLTNGKANALGGKIAIDGLYDTTDPSQPLFDLKYNMADIKFNQIFAASSSFQALAPIAKYIEGLFNTTLVLKGPLQKDMMPDLTQLTASGFLETLKGKVNGFEPLVKIGNALGIDKLKTMDIKGSKNWFEVKDGRVILKPADHQVDDMKFTVGGNHGIDQSIDYTIKAMIPRDKLKKDNLGKNLEFGMSYLEKAATSRGVNIDLGEMIYLDIFLTGTVTKPKIKVLPVGSGGKTLNEVVKNELNKQKEILKDTLMQEMNKRTEAVKDTVTKVVTAATDKVKEQVKEKAKEEVDKHKSAMKDMLKSKVDTAITSKVNDKIETVLKDKTKDILKDASGGEVDSLKSKLKDWNPFKKK